MGEGTAEPERKSRLPLLSVLAICRKTWSKTTKFQKHHENFLKTTGYHRNRGLHPQILNNTAGATLDSEDTSNLEDDVY